MKITEKELEELDIAIDNIDIEINSVQERMDLNRNDHDTWFYLYGRREAYMQFKQSLQSIREMFSLLVEEEE